MSNSSSKVTTNVPQISKDHIERVQGDEGTPFSYREVKDALYPLEKFRGIEDASLVIAPTNVKENGLLCVKPVDGSGDGTYSRADTNGTIVDKDGKIVNACWNLLPNSESFTGSGWSLNSQGSGSAPVLTQNAGTSPRGDVTAVRAQLDQGALGSPNRSRINYVNSSLLEVGAKAKGYIWYKSYAGPDQPFTFGFSGTDTAVQQLTATSEWQKVEVDATITSTGWFFWMGLIDSSVSTTSDILIWGGTIQKGWEDRPYQKTTDRQNMSRVSWDGDEAVILCEPEVTNNIIRSEEFDNFNWVKTQNAGTGLVPVVTANVGISPRGDLIADRVVFDLNGGTTTSDISRIRQLLNPTFTGSGVVSFYVKSFDNVSNYTLTVADADGFAKPVEVTGNWTRVSVKSNSYNIANLVGMGIGIRGGTSVADVLIWGAQLEPGDYPTSYIPTVGTTVTRLKDEFTDFGDVGTFNSEEFTFYIECKALFNSSNLRRIFVSDGSFGNSFVFEYNNSNRLGFILIVNGVTQVNLQFPSVNISNYNKIAVRIKTNDCGFYANGLKLNQVNSAVTFSANTINQLAFSGSLNTFEGKIKALKVYNRGLTDLELERLTS